MYSGLDIAETHGCGSGSLRRTSRKRAAGVQTKRVPLGQRPLEPDEVRVREFR